MPYYSRTTLSVVKVELS